MEPQVVRRVELKIWSMHEIANVKTYSFSLQVPFAHNARSSPKGSILQNNKKDQDNNQQVQQNNKSDQEMTVAPEWPLDHSQNCYIQKGDCYKASVCCEIYIVKSLVEIQQNIMTR